MLEAVAAVGDIEFEKRFPSIVVCNSLGVLNDCEEASEAGLVGTGALARFAGFFGFAGGGAFEFTDDTEGLRLDSGGWD